MLKLYTGTQEQYDKLKDKEDPESEENKNPSEKDKESSEESAVGD